MEIQFQKMVYPCLKTVCRQMQNQELTQEVRLPDGMPDIGNILGGWGQVVIRGKQWRTGNAGVNGGIMAWVLYIPEEGGPVQRMETWLPFQHSWDFPDTQYDGNLQVQPVLRNVDARLLSARKMMVRASLGMLGCATVGEDMQVYTSAEIPEDVYALQKSYPMLLPVEAGEKAFFLEESIRPDAGTVPVGNILRYSLTPMLSEMKVVSDKLIFRGNANLSMVYLGTDGLVHTWSTEIPFSQYTQLNREYEPNAQADIQFVLTSLELEPAEEENLTLKAGITGQYTLYDMSVVDVAEDAYSPNRLVKVRTEPMACPAVLDYRQEPLSISHSAQTDIVRPLDVVFYPEQPVMQRQDKGVQAQLGGNFQVLGYDADGQLISQQSRWEDSRFVPADESADVEMDMLWAGAPSVDGNNLSAPMQLTTRTTAQQAMDMVAGLELGDVKDPDPQRPSLILRRAGTDSLWNLAKENGSTVQAIQQANDLQTEPDPDKMLLIPVL